MRGPDFDRYLLGFLRAGEGERAQVVEACHGADWYVNDAYSGPCSFRYPQEWDAYAGHYRAHNPWASNFRVLIRKGKPLLVRPAGDEEPLTPVGNPEFRVGRDAFSQAMTTIGFSRYSVSSATASHRHASVACLGVCVGSMGPKLGIEGTSGVVALLGADIEDASHSHQQTPRTSFHTVP